MKNRIYILPSILIMCGMVFQNLAGQTVEESKKSVKYNAWVTLINSSTQMKGYLLEVGDSSLIITNPSNQHNTIIYINNIKEIKFRQEGRVGRGILIGALSGIALGGIAGLAQKPDKDRFFNPPAGQIALVGGIAMGVSGAIIGSAIGSFKIKIPIDANENNHKDKLIKYQLNY